MRSLNNHQNFPITAPRQVQIASWIAHHGNSAKRTDIIEAFADQNNKKQVESLLRTLYNMKGKRIIKENADGTLCLTNPNEYRIIRKWIRGNFLDRWTMLTVPFSVLGLLFSILEGTQISMFFWLIITCFIVLWHLDDYYHTNKGY